MTRPKNSNCDKIQKLKLLQFKNFNCAKTKTKTQIVTKLTISNWDNSGNQIVAKLKNSNCDPTQKLKLLQNAKKLTVTKLKNTNCDQS